MASDAAPGNIDVKVKTLNSQTHDFSVPNDMTVRQFKEHIAGTVSIQPDLQRIIYRGRILNDGMQLKEYDMHGKVVHLVERPPPGPGGPEAGTGADNPQPNTTPGTGRRRVFLHRGANGQPTAAGGTASTTGAPPNLSSTLCLNRITVARHMLQCAQNIINHMDNPQVPLDNSPMDLLVQETLDTTVVEVGISTISDVDNVQDIMHAFRGAVNAAFRPGGAASGGADDSEGNIDLNSSTSSSASSLSSSFDPADGAGAASSAVPMESQPATAPPAPMAEGEESSTTDRPTTEGAEAGSATSSAETGAAPNAPSSGRPGGSSTQTTSPRVLGEVVEEMRNVQRRLEPHLQRYYDILMNEPTYTAEETTRREDDQREFDRVSEALHYMSHAQHAISDLMLDLSSTSPRHLCCRPILIEHSAFVNAGLPPPTGDILLAMGGMGAPGGGFQFTVPLNGEMAMGMAAGNPPSAEGGAAPAGATPTGGGSAPGTPRRVPVTGPVPPGGRARIPAHHHHHMATIPILVQQTHSGLPTMEQLHQSAAAAAAALNSNGIHDLIQSIVSAAPMATIEVQRGNEPPITINVPPGPQGAASMAGENAGANNEQAAGGGGGNAAPNGRTPSATTMPTTSTQTRSTARPQVHVASLQQPAEMRGPRPFSSSAFSAFDRYLPCNSHHVRNQQQRAGGNGQTGAQGGAAAGTGAPGGRENVIRIPHGRIEIPIGFPFPLRRPASNVPSNRASSESQDRPSGTATPSSTASARSVTPIEDLDVVYNSPDPDEEFVNGNREDLYAFIVARFFNHNPITMENIKEGVSEIVIQLEELLAPISSYEHPHICIRLSVLEVLRTHLQELLNLLRREESDSDEAAIAAEQRFAVNFIRSIRLLASRLSSVLLQSNRRRQEIRQMFRGIFVRFVKDMGEKPLGRLLKFALKVCLQTLDTKFGTGESSDLRPFFVYKSPEVSPMEVEESEVASAVSQDVNMESQPSTSGGSSSSSASSNTTTTASRSVLTRLRWDSETEDYPEPTVSAPWHANVPSGWLGTLASDVEEQKKITDAKAQPLSDAYLEGMSKKRRKTITDARPTGSVQETIGVNVRQVIQSSGFQVDTPVDQIASQISSDVGLQSSYRESMNATIRERLRTDPNYDPKKYANSEKYFK